MSKRNREISIAAMFAALAVVLAFFCKTMGIPLVAVSFLHFDCKDFIIAISGFVLNPLYAVGISFVVALIEVLTFSDTQIWGMVMNFISSAVFAGVASIIYYRWRNIRGAVLGLLCSTVMTTIVMLGWNYLIVPLYTPMYTRDAVAKMLLPTFLPYNLIKYSINAGITLFVYKPLTTALQQIGFLERKNGEKLRINPLTYAVGAAFILLSVGAILIIRL